MSKQLEELEKMLFILFESSFSAPYGRIDYTV